MTKDKDFKRLIRARMEKTGESYTAARANLLAKSPPPLPDDYATLAGASDESVAKATGRAWPEWVAELDAARAAELSHAEIAALIGERFDGVSGWWAQTVTVGYERLRGLRDVGQVRGGGYRIGRSRTVPVPVAELWRAVEEDTVRAQWLPEEITIRKATPHRSMRIRLADDTPLDAYFEEKGPSKSTIHLQHRELPDRETAEAMKKRWGERLTALKALMADDA